MSGHVCPECGVHRPDCACARAQAQAAELAAAEDFDPLRIRPYVTLGATEDETVVVAAVAPAAVPEGGVPLTQAGPLPTAGPLPAEVPGPGATGDPSETMPLFLPRAAEYGEEQGQGQGQGYAAGYAPGYAPGPTHDHSPDHSPDYEPAHTLAYAPEEPRRAGRGRALVVAGVVAVAVVGTAVLATALIGGADADDRAAVPEVTTSASENVAVSEEPSTPPTPSATASPSARTTSASPSASASPTAARPSASATPAAPVTSRTASAAPTSAPAVAPSATRAPSGPTLSLGSTGAEVAELQRRLKELWLYSGPEDGKYTRKVERAVEVYQSYKYLEDDPRGVYGPSTRRALEAETTG